MTKKIQAKRLCLILSVLIASSINRVTNAEVPLQYHASLSFQASTETLAPYMLGSWNEGRFSEGSGLWQEAGIHKPLDTTKRFDWSAGIDYIAGFGSETSYQRWDNTSESWGTHKIHLPYLRLQQLYGQLKYRSLQLTAGMKYSHSKIIDDTMSSGDLTRSNNAMPIPGVSVGFIDFQDIPFTNGWVQIDGEIMYGKMTDNGFNNREFNYYSGVRAINRWYNYKRCYFRTNPDKKFHVTLGMQAAGMFGGATYLYNKGNVYYSSVRGFRVKDMFQMLFPTEGGERYYTGNHLGSWDLKATYRFNGGSSIDAYFEWPWEDGSGIGKKNGWDGLWGLQYNFGKEGYITKVVVEYLDFTNQSGPIHFAPNDHPGTQVTGQAQGADDYYNNDDYGSYTNYGLGIGTPFLMSPLYNRDGMLDYLHNRARGFHAAFEGNPDPRLSYRVKVSYQHAGGNGWVPSPNYLHNTSASLEAKAIPLKKIPELSLGLCIAFDKGDLRGDNFGGRIKIEYSGDFKIKSKKK